MRSPVKTLDLNTNLRKTFNRPEQVPIVSKETQNLNQTGAKKWAHELLIFSTGKPQRKQEEIQNLKLGLEAFKQNEEDLKRSFQNLLISFCLLTFFVVSIWAFKEPLMYSINPSYLLSQMGQAQLIEREELCTKSGDRECVFLVRQRLLEMSHAEGSSLSTTKSSFEKMRRVKNLVIGKSPTASCSPRERLLPSYSDGEESKKSEICELKKMNSFH